MSGGERGGALWVRSESRCKVRRKREEKDRALNALMSSSLVRTLLACLFAACGQLELSSVPFAESAACGKRVLSTVDLV